MFISLLISVMWQLAVPIYGDLQRGWSILFDQSYWWKLTAVPCYLGTYCRQAMIYQFSALHDRISIYNHVLDTSFTPFHSTCPKLYCRQIEIKLVLGSLTTMNGEEGGFELDNHETLTGHQQSIMFAIHCTPRSVFSKIEFLLNMCLRL